MLVYFYNFRQFYIYFLSFSKEKGKGKGRTAAGGSVTSHVIRIKTKRRSPTGEQSPQMLRHALSAKSPNGLSADDGCRRIKAKKLPLPGEQAPQMLRHALSAKSPNGLSTDDGCRRNKPKKEPVWLASYQTGSFLVLISLVTRQIGCYTGSRRIRPVPGGFHGCPVR